MKHARDASSGDHEIYVSVAESLKQRRPVQLWHGVGGPCWFHFEHEIECTLMLDRTLAVETGPTSKTRLSVPFPYDDREPFGGRCASP